MAATVTVRVNTGSSAGTESSAVTGIDFISDDNATNNLTNRQTYPITVGTNSYEKWLTLKIDAKPANNISNIQIWGDGAVTTSTSLYFTGNYATGTTPVNTTSSIADTDFTGYTAGNKATWDAGPYTNTNDVTNFAVFQLQVDADAGPGNWEQETISYSYDET